MAVDAGGGIAAGQVAQYTRRLKNAPQTRFFAEIDPFIVLSGFLRREAVFALTKDIDIKLKQPKYKTLP